MPTNVQVYQDPDGTRWGVRVTGGDATEPIMFDTKDQAIQEGRRLADERGAELLVHDESGETETKEAPTEE
jgi:hypothetical protein